MLTHKQLRGSETDVLTTESRLILDSKGYTGGPLYIDKGRGCASGRRGGELGKIMCNVGRGYGCQGESDTAQRLKATTMWIVHTAKYRRHNGSFLSKASDSFGIQRHAWDG